ncbi:MAG: hypothetical protein JSW41_05370 [Candidatus Aenigmatarchaeota archaeon]|nr:MAG: hypothetical protein JSW41_05370 [Candidatus Aenigmarchaeota archaeon]
MSKKNKKNVGIPKKKEEKDSKFIPFGKIQKSYLREVFIRTNQEFNHAVDAVYEEMGIQERVNKNPERFKINPDFSGVEILPVPPKEQTGRPPETPEKENETPPKGKDH